MSRAWVAVTCYIVRRPRVGPCGPRVVVRRPKVRDYGEYSWFLVLFPGLTRKNMGAAKSPKILQVEDVGGNLFSAQQHPSRQGEVAYILRLGSPKRPYLLHLITFPVI